MSVLVLALELYFAAMLGVSGLAKIDSPGRFAHTLRRHGILPAWSIPTVSVTLPCLELVVAGLLITGVAIIPAAVAVAGLFLSFLAIEAFLLATKRATDCGCYGVAFPQKVDGASVAASIVLTSLATFHLLAIMWVAPLSLGWRLPGIVLLGGTGLWLFTKVIRRRLRALMVHRRRLAHVVSA